MKIQGKTHKFGDHIDTDIIIPARYLTTADPEALAKYCMEAVDPEFHTKVEPGDILVAGENFGCGSSREHAPIAIRGTGIGCILAKSFARIFYRNCLNIGLPILECPEAIDEIEAGDLMSVDLEDGVVENLTQGKIYQAQAFSPEIQAMIQAGGLLPMIKAEGDLA